MISYQFSERLDQFYSLSGVILVKQWINNAITVQWTHSTTCLQRILRGPHVLVRYSKLSATQSFPQLWPNTVSLKFLCVRKKSYSVICQPNEGLLLVSVLNRFLVCRNLRSSLVRIYVPQPCAFTFLICTNLCSSFVRIYVPHPYELAFLIRTNLYSSFQRT